MLKASDPAGPRPSLFGSCQNSTSCLRQNKLKAAGADDPLAHLAARTDGGRDRGAEPDLHAPLDAARLHIVHESCAGSLPFIRFWKQRGVDVTVETLPQYLYLSARSWPPPVARCCA